MIPSVRFLAYPQGSTSKSFAVKSVSFVEDDTNTCNLMGPVTSNGFSNGSVQYINTSSLVSIAEWSNAPGAMKLGLQHNPPPIVGTGFPGL